MLDEAPAMDLSQRPYEAALPIKMAPYCWRVLEVSSLSSAHASSALAPPLSNAGVSILYHSSFHHDFVLVQEGHLPLALKVLESLNIVSITFAQPDEDIVVLSADSFNLLYTAPSPVKTSFPDDPEAAVKATADPTPGPPPYALQLPQCHLVMTFLERDSQTPEQLIVAILQTLFFPLSAPAFFFSLTTTPQGSSLILPARECERHRLLHHLGEQHQVWSLIKIHGQLDFDSVGYVSTLAGALTSTCSDPVLYISTFLTDYAMLENDGLPPATLQSLQQHFTILPNP
jgi:hypothetical protein